MSTRRVPIALALAGLLAGMLAAPPAGAVPGNDAFENAEAMTSLPFTATGDLANATRQPGEPIDCYALRRSVWYSFTAVDETDVSVQLTNVSSAYGSMAVYTGTTLGNLVRKYCTTSTFSSGFAITVAPAETIWVQIGAGLDGAPSATMTAKALTRISGTVTDGVTGLPGICVTAYAQSSPFTTKGTSTLPDGSYTIKAVASGNHKVKFAACKDAKYVTEYWNDKATSAEADLVATSLDTGVTTGVDAALARQSRLTGTLTDRRGKPAVSCVDALQDGKVVASGSSNSAGAYAFGVAPGTYIVRMGCFFYTKEYYPEKPTEAEAVSVEVPAQTDFPLGNAELEPGGTIGGRLTNPAGDPVSDCVEAIDPDGKVVRTASSNGQGSYDLFGLATGTYRLRLAGCFFANGLTTWYGGDSFETATPIDVMYGQDVLGKDGVISGGATIVGRLTDEQGFPLPYECVGLYTESGEPVRTYSTDGTGSYIAKRLPEGAYKLRFGCTRDLQPEWYDNASDAVSATPVFTSLAAPATGVNAVLAFKTAPANDALSSATVVSTLPFKETLDVTMATMEAGEPNRCGSSTMRGSIWYRYTAAEPALVRASTEGTIDFDTIIAVYIQGPNGLLQLDCANDHANFVGERMDFVALSGVETLIQVSGSAAWPPLYTGLVKFNLS